MHQNTLVSHCSNTRGEHCLVLFALLSSVLWRIVPVVTVGFNSATCPLFMGLVLYLVVTVISGKRCKVNYVKNLHKQLLLMQPKQIYNQILPKLMILSFFCSQFAGLYSIGNQQNTYFCLSNCVSNAISTAHVRL